MKERRKLITPQGTTALAGWTYADRRAVTRDEIAGLVRMQEAVRDGRLSPGELIDLFARVYHCGSEFPAPLELPEPAIWTGSEEWQIGQAKLDTEKVAEILELRRKGWSTGDLAKRFGVTRSTICNVLLGRTHYLPPRPAPLPLILPAAEKPRTVSQAAEPVIWTGAVSVQDPTLQPAAKLTYEIVDEARELRAKAGT